MRGRSRLEEMGVAVLAGVLCFSAVEAVAGGTALAATAGTLSIFAGTGKLGAPTPGSATRSDLDSPFGVAVDSATGDVYIAETPNNVDGGDPDSNNNEILRVTPAGTLSIFAGTGRRGAPTPGPATRSDLDGPGGVAVDSATGDVYIADSHNFEVERVTPSGRLSIFAGTGKLGVLTPGPATRSELYFPFGVAVDSATGDVYIADSPDNEILRVTPSGRLSIFAGTGKLGVPTPGPATRSDLNDPGGVAVDSATGDVYIADTLNNEVERVTPTGGLSIVAGTGTHGVPTPGPPTRSDLFWPYAAAVDSATGDVYIADTDNNKVERVTPTTREELTGGHRLSGGEELVNTTSDERLVVQASDGNLVLYRGSTPIWSAETKGNPGDYLAMQASDGNLVVYSVSGGVVWSAHTTGHPGDHLVLQGDGNLVVYTSAGKAIWATGTNRPELTLGADGLGPVPFGTSEARAIGELTQLLGSPSGRGVNTACAPAFFEVYWGELAVEFHKDVFTGYRDSNEPKGILPLGYANSPIVPVRPAAETAVGIRLGDTLSQVRARYPELSLVGANRFEAPDGLEFTDNGPLSPGGPHSRIVQIRIDACGAY